MAFVFTRRFAIPLWVIAFLVVAVTTPTPAPLFLMPVTALFVVAAVGMAAIVFSMPRPIPWLSTSRALVHALPFGQRDQASAAITMAAGTGVRTLDETNRSEAEDALDLVRMDDDGGWPMARPPA